MFTAQIENKNGDVLTLTGQEASFQLLDITGLNPPAAQINTATIAGMDGAMFNSSRLNTRNIVLLIKINGNAEENRLRLYTYFRTKDWCKFYYANGSRDVSIEGYVESVECNMFSNAETAQISIICPNPYFRSIDEEVAHSGNIQPGFTFPFSINVNEPVVISSISEDETIRVLNSSETDTGVVVEIEAERSFSQLVIENTRTGESFELDYSFIQGDTIYINTNKGEKSVYLIRSGQIINMFPALKLGSKFFTILPGENVFQYSVDGTESSDAVYFTFRYYNVFRGV